MGTEKYLNDVKKLFEKSPVVSYNSIQKIVLYKKGSKKYAKMLVHYLLSKGIIKKLAKGYYTQKEELSLAVFCFQPAYLGLQDALSHYNLWEQETIPIIITTRKIRPGIRNILWQNVLVRRIDKKYFFGINYIQDDKSAIPYSDIEKTFIDMIYFNEPLDKEVISEFKHKIDFKKLKRYLKNYPKMIRKKVNNVLER